ncbi:unnamed protein product [[Candida] boidinii]|uniref:Unnamed protein product n=1 Tax=Candida boidinii TaxID=5477 RepID=A0ACB5UB36_CANBO|nr:unnamed protein product [[Candida] boidinii]
MDIGHMVLQDLQQQNQQQTILSVQAIQDPTKTNNTNSNQILIFTAQMLHIMTLKVSNIIITLVLNTLDLLIGQDKDTREPLKNMMKHSEDFKHISMIIQCLKI